MANPIVHTNDQLKIEIRVYDNSVSDWGWFVEIEGVPTARFEMQPEQRAYVEKYMKDTFPRMI